MLQGALELQTNSKEITEHLYYISFDIMHIVLL